MRYFLGLSTGLYLLLGVAQAQSCPSAPTLDAKEVVAQWGKERIALGEVDADIADELCRARIEYNRKVDTLRRAALHEAVDGRLLAAAAKKAKLPSLQALLKKTVFEKVTPPTKADIKAFYQANEAQMGGATLEQVQDQISAYLVETAQFQAQERYVSQLRQAAKVKLTLPPFRVTLAPTGPARGPKDAAVVIVSFADYQCPYCAVGAKTLQTVQSRYPKKVRVVFKDFPLDFHEGAVPAAVAARCAGQQKKYWAMHDLIFQRPDFTAADLATYAKEIGLDSAAFAACSADPKTAKAVYDDRRLGEKFGVDGTPAFFVNGIPLSGSQPVDAFVEIIDAELGKTP